MHSILILLIGLGLAGLSGCSPKPDEDNFEQKANALIKQMSLDEKIGQLNVKWADTRVIDTSEVNQLVRAGKTGAVFFVWGVDKVRNIQKQAVENSRLKIPLMFGLDVVNGHRTVFPIGIAQSCSWDMDLIRRIERGAASEASAEGINWVFSPMVDISRDPRWGRMCESPGEDTWLASRIAEAKIKGFQGDDLAANNTVMACPKHFVGYGAPVAGKDYNFVDISTRSLYEWYLPPYKACIDAGAGSLMASFNDLNGVPSTANKGVLTDLIRKKWGFDGFVVSDWEAILELVPYGIAKDLSESAALSFNAGLDLDMQSETYLKYLKENVENGKVSEESINQAVRNILIAKYKLGLFDDPYRYCNKEREATEVMSDGMISLAREAAAKTSVLLKNEKHSLPISKDIKSIAVIGPLADSKRDHLGSNLIAGDPEKVVSILEGIKNKIPATTKLLYEKGCNVDDTDATMIGEAVKKASKADMVILVVGEDASMSGESKSRSDISLPGVQQDLAREIIKTGKPCIMVVCSGRPLLLTEFDKSASAILMVWQAGIQAGNGIADVLFGDYNPSARLSVSFPRNMGQIPLYYNTTRIGRPVADPDISGKTQDWRSRYIDSPNAPLYPFGYGLSYTDFAYSDLKMSKEKYTGDEEIEVSVKIANTGNYEGEETVQLYLTDLITEITRPLIELKAAQKVFLKKGESKTLNFRLTKEDLAYYHSDMTFRYDPGEFEVHVGRNSRDSQMVKFSVD
ncbi:MAG: beta-glucosidase BglX [Bacteroidales bacterium]|nr:beta-glucosidase BglX [Bacteroidales bacterium]MCB8999381.1 beta-glucosidase BglX [Bacteroidales bacterium]